MSSRAEATPVVAALLVLFLGGCIERYAAPTAPIEVTSPYLSIAGWQGIELPAGTGDEPPDAAIRVAITARGAYADTILLGPKDGATADGWPAVMELIGDRSEPIVVLSAATQCDRFPAERTVYAVLADGVVQTIPHTQACSTATE